MAPSAVLTHGGEQSYADLIQPWMNTATHDRGMLVHAYALEDKREQKLMDELSQRLPRKDVY